MDIEFDAFYDYQIIQGFVKLLPSITDSIMDCFLQIRILSL